MTGLQTGRWYTSSQGDTMSWGSGGAQKRRALAESISSSNDAVSTCTPPVTPSHLGTARGARRKMETTVTVMS